MYYSNQALNYQIRKVKLKPFGFTSKAFLFYITNEINSLLQFNNLQVQLWLTPIICYQTFLLLNRKTEISRAFYHVLSLMDYMSLALVNGLQTQAFFLFKL